MYRKNKYKTAVTLRSVDLENNFAIIETEDFDRHIIGINQLKKLVPDLKPNTKFFVTLLNDERG